jgi:UDP-N-acetylglucosamine 2-epimerase (non-hydrolysing)
MLIDLIAGARPNFMKIAPVIDAIRAEQVNGVNLSFRLVHTGQHYDRNMSEQFFEQLGIPEPDVNLGAGGGTQAEQTARIMVAYEALLLEKPCDLCVVVGDVNSTMGCAIAAKKLNILVAHVEAGIRSGDRSMPEEINRIVTDSISDFFFTTTPEASSNLLKLGISADRIYFVGNTMIDTLLRHRQNFRKPEFWDNHGLINKKYVVLTLHRPSNVDDTVQLSTLLQTILDNTHSSPVIFPVHPRTRKNLEKSNIVDSRLIRVEPMGYLEFNYLVEHSFAVITDSGGITEETTVLGVPCMTLRDTTERPETVTIGTNVLLGTHHSAIVPALETLFAGRWKTGGIPEKWDGHTAERIVEHIISDIKSN